MDIILPLIPNEGAWDDDRIASEVIDDIDNGIRINIWDEIYDANEEELFNVHIEYGDRPDGIIRCRASMDDIEMFAHSLLKRIEMIRRDYSDRIRKRRESGQRI